MMSVGYSRLLIAVYPEAINQIAPADRELLDTMTATQQRIGMAVMTVFGVLVAIMAGLFIWAYHRAFNGVWEKGRSMLHGRDR
jgi:hypothetical protein